MSDGFFGKIAKVMDENIIIINKGSKRWCN